MTELSKSIAHDLMIHIVSGTYRRGESFPKESELCVEYNVSRVVIREAKKRLQTLGMLQTKKKAGSTVMPKMMWNFFNQDLFSLYLEYSNDFEQQMDSYYTLRRLLEPEITASVALRSSQQDIDYLKEKVDILRWAYQNQDASALNQADLDFHLKIYEASNNILVYPLANLMIPLFLKSFSVTMVEWEMGLAEHVAVFDAISTHNAEAARRAALEIVEAGYNRFRRNMTAQKKDG